jgi:hypothetical protein
MLYPVGPYPASLFAASYTKCPQSASGYVLREAWLLAVLLAVGICGGG